MTEDTVKLETEYKSGLCNSCQSNEAADPHTCPFASEINGDDESLCDCCDECERECSQSI